MVYIKALKEEIMDNEYLSIAMPELPIGSGGMDKLVEVILFDKQDVIVNKIEKLPVLRGIQINFAFAAEIFDRMVASALETLRAEVWVYNGADVVENLICHKNGYVSVMGGTTMIFIDSDPTRDVSYLLNDKITVALRLNIDDLVAGAAFLVNMVIARVIFDLDWVAITTDELKTYAVEQLYVNM